MFKCAPYDVVVWLRIHPESLTLRERIFDQAGRFPDENAELQGMRDMHWGFDTALDAVSFAESLFEVAVSDDLVLLSIVARRDESFGRKVYKDSRASISRSVAHHSR